MQFFSLIFSGFLGTMEVVGLSSVENNMWVFSVLESMVVETVLAAGKSLACHIMVV